MHVLLVQAHFDELGQQAIQQKLLIKTQPIDPPQANQGVYGQPHDYEGGFVLLTVTHQKQDLTEH